MRAVERAYMVLEEREEVCEENIFVGTRGRIEVDVCGRVVTIGIGEVVRAYRNGFDGKPIEEAVCVNKVRFDADVFEAICGWIMNEGYVLGCDSRWKVVDKYR